MSSCDEEILLLDAAKDWPASSATATGPGSGVVGVGVANNGDTEFSDDEQQQQQFHHHHHLMGVGFKRQQLEMSGGAEFSGLPNKSGASSDGSERDQPENSDDTKGPSSKRLKAMQQQQQQHGQVDSFKKDREEWSDTAICALLDAYTEKFLQLNKGNLRGKHWQEVSNMVSMRCQGQKSMKTIEQCKNKVDSLKKRHKVERTRMENTGSTTSQWPWFSKVEQIVGSAPKLSVLLEDDTSMVIKPDKQKGAMRQRRPNCRTPSVSPCANSLGFHTKTKILQPRWQRVLLKVSGDALAGDRVQNVDQKITLLVAKEVASAMRLGVEVAVVVGGGNFFRGANWVGTSGLDRASADHIGMMATMMNAVILQASFESVGIKARIQTSYTMTQVAEPFSSKKAIRHLEKGRVVIFGGGTGNPYFTTDTAAAIRAAELKAEIILKAANIDGVFDCDSNFLEHVSFRELAMKGLSALDAEAMSHCERHNIPVMLFNISEPGNVVKALTGERVGTLIDQTGKFV
ncbi:uncharacterized protein LOC9633437 [Selaginella moellendorffii]|uniref:uncharacterized protein LOC9633437 n=1 Tax=Selaginella moellendorffii TaxID=88036 RepID=UPI000D1D0C83|nr:uncharacterized protein LOC9633437 [Selaginella moellendorffii]|eukprot:XP_024521281.1 uncharacterized protein LOC9633437 [Selaginella moellendorffii]